MSLLQIIEEQSSFCFTGKINILLLDNGRFVGAIFQKDGFIVNASFYAASGKNALYNIIFSDIDSSIINHKYIVEPEVISDSDVSLKLKYSEMYKEAQELAAKFKASIEMRPPMNLTIKCILSGFNLNKLNSKEKNVLRLIESQKIVSEIYRKSTILEFELTDILVSFRKKGIIKVYRN